MQSVKAQSRLSPESIAKLKMRMDLKDMDLEALETKIADYCRRWKITEFALFGSVLHDNFGPESDLDVLVTFAADTTWTLLDHVQMQDELKATFGREVDLVSKRGIENSRNYIRRKKILDSAKVIYVTQ